MPYRRPAVVDSFGYKGFRCNAQRSQILAVVLTDLSKIFLVEYLRLFVFPIVLYGLAKSGVI